MDLDGQPTTWGFWGPNRLNDDPKYWEERGLGSEHSGCLLGGCALQRSILLGRHGAMSALAERQAQKDAASAAVDMLSDGSAHSEEAITRMRGNGHDGRWHGFLWERLRE